MTPILIFISDQQQMGLPDHIANDCHIVWHSVGRAISSSGRWSIMIPFREIEIFRPLDGASVENTLAGLKRFFLR